MARNKPQPFRLDSGGRINRDRPLSFVFNGRTYSGYEGDTAASALLANGVHLVGRSFKYHRPRGIVGAGLEEPNALLQVGTGARTTPNLRATEVQLSDGMVLKSVNCWPSANRDIAAINSKLTRFLPPGFYYKTFMWPRRMWSTYEGVIRKAAGLGESPRAPDPDIYDRMNAHCDVLIAGGGPAGLAAALEAGATGARVILADDGAEFGGNLLSSRRTIGGMPARDWIEDAVRQLSEMPEVKLLPRSSVFGYYDHNFLAIAQSFTPEQAASHPHHPNQRVWRVRAKQVVIAAGSFERPLIFPNNDVPGVMLASAVSSYINRYAVLPGRRVVLFTNNDSGYRTALDLADAGAEIRAVVDLRPNPLGALPASARDKGIRVIGSHAVVDVKGVKKVKGVVIMDLDQRGTGVRGDAKTIDCDLLAVSGGWNPTVHLHSQSGGKVRFDENLGGFVPGESVQQERSAGACGGAFDLASCIREGLTAGAGAAREAGFGDGVVQTPLPATDDVTEEPPKIVWLVPSRKDPVHEHKQFIDLQEDVSAGDVVLAANEGYDSVPLLNRYTTLGFGTDQGKLGNVIGMGVLADHLGKDITDVGGVTFRQPYAPVTLGAIAGGEVGEMLDPVRKTAIHPWHVAHGALFENVGQWKRPWYYPNTGESMQDALNRECLAARNAVAILDQSTLGKIDVRGRDAAEFLNRMYSNNWLKLGEGRARYGLMLGEDGMVMDDGVSARISPGRFHMFTTTGGAANVMTWLEQWLQTEWPELQVYLTSVTDQWTTMSVVGPRARDTVAKICGDIEFSHEAFPFLSFREGTVAGVPARVFRISFSGELTFEINVPADYGLHVWESVMEAGAEFGITPYGTETMHILRAEKAFIIVGQDTDGTVTPSDLGLDWLVSNRKDFLGKRSLSRPDIVRKDRKQLVGLTSEYPVRVIPDGAQIVDDPRGPIPIKMIGHVTSSYYSASLGHPVALALVKGGRARIGQRVYIPLHDGNSITARVTNPVFYDPKNERQNV